MTNEEIRNLAEETFQEIVKALGDVFEPGDLTVQEASSCGWFIESALQKVAAHGKEKETVEPVVIWEGEVPVYVTPQGDTGGGLAPVEKLGQLFISNQGLYPHVGEHVHVVITSQKEVKDA